MMVAWFLGTVAGFCAGTIIGMMLGLPIEQAAIGPAVTAPLAAVAGTFVGKFLFR